MNTPTPIPVKDFLGRDITPGCIIVYGHLLGRCAALKMGKVLKVKGEQIGMYSNNTPRCEYRITVQGVEEDQWIWDKKTQVGTRVPYGLCRKGCLQYPDRCMVVDPRDIPPAIRAVLDTVKV